MSSLSSREKMIIINLINDKIDICQRHIRKFEKDYKWYTGDRMNWLGDEKLGSVNSKYAKEVKRQIDLENKKIEEYREIISKVNNG